MELNANLIGVQGILVKCVKQTGNFTNINYRGGNEKHIAYIAAELGNFLIGKELMQEKNVLPNKAQEVNNIIFFLALNTEFKRPLTDLEEYPHLKNIVPQLSKCLLANICFELNLVEPYGNLIERLSLEATEELLDQIIECLRHGKINEHLDHAFVILKSVVNKLTITELSYKTEDTVDNIVTVATIILQNLTDVTMEQAESLKIKKLYQYMGFTLIKFLDLLLYMNENNEALKALVVSVISTTCNLIKCVTINVFCSWSEVEYEAQPLQISIADKAYFVIEKYQKNKASSELISMLSTLARKPKTVAERILEADIPTMIKMVNEKGEHQQLWFRAILNTPVYSNPKVLECIEKWWQLCDENSVDRLLSLPLPQDPKSRQILVKCASNLCLESLCRVLTIYFYRDKFNWADDIDDQLIVTFNQIKENISEEETKQILLLVLQNAKSFFLHFYRTAFKRSRELIPIFKITTDLSKIDNIGLRMLMEIFDENVPCEQNISNYVQLFDTLVTSEYCTWTIIVSNILMPLMNKYRYDENCLEEFKCCLHILKHFVNLKCDLPREIEVFEYLLKCASENRCKSFLEFNSLKQDITSCCVDYIYQKCQDFRLIEGRKESFPNIGCNCSDAWSKYYKNLFLIYENSSFVDTIVPNINLSDYKEGEADEYFTMLLKILPQCVSTEWNILLKELVLKWGFFNVLNVLSDIIILLSTFTENQIREGKNPELLIALQFCLQNYGNFLVSANSPEDKILTINTLCRTLKHIPNQLKPTEGMSLINSLSEDTLKSMAGDKEFIARIVQISDKQLCKAMAQKVLASANRSDN